MIDRFTLTPLRADEIKTLYRERLVRDFPPQELKPLSVIMKALEQDAYVGYGAVVGESILAYAFFVKRGNDALVDYYAVREDLRDAGIGSRFIQKLIAGPLQAMNCVLLEIEDPDCTEDIRERETRIRRLNFYTRNGLVETGVKAIVWGVQFCVLELPLGAWHPPRIIQSVYSGIYRVILPEKVYRERFRIVSISR